MLALGTGYPKTNQEVVKKKKRKKENEGCVCATNCVLRKATEFRKVHMRKGINNVLWMGVVPGRVWGGESPRYGTNSERNVKKGIWPAQQERCLQSRFHCFLEIDKQEDRARSGGCSDVFLGASSLNGTMGGTYEGSLEETDVCSYFVEDGPRSSRSGLLGNIRPQFHASNLAGS